MRRHWGWIQGCCRAPRTSTRSATSTRHTSAEGSQSSCTSNVFQLSSLKWTGRTCKWSRPTSRLRSTRRRSSRLWNGTTTGRRRSSLPRLIRRFISGLRRRFRRQGNGRKSWRGRRIGLGWRRSSNWWGKITPGGMMRRKGLKGRRNWHRKKSNARRKPWGSSI